MVRRMHDYGVKEVVGRGAIHTNLFSCPSIILLALFGEQDDFLYICNVFRAEWAFFNTVPTDKLKLDWKWPRETFTVPEPIHASPKEVKLSPGESAIVEILGGWHDYGVAIDYQDIASIVKDETTDATHIKVMGLTNGNATLTIGDQRTKEKIDVPIIVTDDIPSDKTCPDDHHPHLIDLGLPSGTKWSCCNVDAESPEGFGGYYAWGETKTKSEYTWNTYKYGQQDSDGRWHGKVLGSNISATDYDAAYSEWGHEWAMPSVDQIQEMLGYCTSEWTTVNGVEGLSFTSRINGGTIFLPASGYRFGTEVRDSGSNGYYWSDTQSTNFDSYAYDLTFSKGDMGWGDFSRYIGLTIRPVNAPK